MTKASKHKRGAAPLRIPANRTLSRQGPDRFRYLALLIQLITLITPALALRTEGVPIRPSIVALTIPASSEEPPILSLRQWESLK